MSDKNNDLIEDQIKEFAEEAGLIFSGRNEEGEIEWLGTNKSWDKFTSLTQGLK
jgi:hypothetical protein